jgi:hypothetical protein
VARATIRDVAWFPESSAVGSEPDAGTALSVVEQLARCSKSACLGSSLRRRGNGRPTACRIVPLSQDRRCCQEGQRPSYRVAGQLREVRHTAITCQNAIRRPRQPMPRRRQGCARRHRRTPVVSRTAILCEGASRGAICPDQQRNNLRRFRIGRAPAAVASCLNLH